MAYELIFKRAFQNQSRALPKKQRMLVQEKIDLLCDDPLPDGHVKEKVHQFKCKEPVFRLRCGDYRVIYPRDAQRADSKEASVSAGGSPAPMLLSPPYGHLVETPLERDTPLGNEVPPGTTSCKSCRSVPIPWARRCEQDDTACS